MSFLKHFDILGKNLGFEENGFTSFKTSQGTIISLLGFTVSIIISSMFGSEVWERKQPNVSIAEEALLSSEIKFKDFPYLIGVYTNVGASIPDYMSIINIDLIRVSINEKEVKLETAKNFTECRPELFTTHTDLVRQTITGFNNKFLCVDSLNDDPYFSNSFGYLNSVSYMIEISKCNKLTQKCHPDLDVIVKDFYITAIMFNSYSDPSNYENPVTFLPETIAQQCTDSLSKRNYVRITRDLFESDNGWLLAAKEPIDYISLESIKIDLNQATKSLYGDSIVLYNITFEAPKKRIKTLRNYMKVQDLFAKIGGLMNVIFIIFRVLCSHFIDFKYKCYVLNSTLFQDKINFFDKGFKDKLKNQVDDSQIRVNNINIENTLKKVASADQMDACESKAIHNNYLYK